MPKVTITAPDDAPVTVIGRNTFTGADGASVTIEAGKSADIELDANNQAVLSSPAVAGGAPASQTPPVANAVAEKGSGTGTQAPALVDASDKQVIDAINALKADQTNLTGSGKVTTEKLNAALAEQGLKPVTADRRDALSAA